MFYLGEKKCFTAVINIFSKKHCSSSISLSSRWETRLAPGPRAGSWQNCGETPGLQNTIESHMVYRGEQRRGQLQRQSATWARPRYLDLENKGPQVLFANICLRQGQNLAHPGLRSTGLPSCWRSYRTFSAGSHELFVSFLPAWLVLT